MKKSKGKDKKGLIRVILSVICISAFLLFFIPALKLLILPGVDKISGASEKVRLTKEEESIQIDEVNSKYVILEKEAADKYIILTTEFKEKYEALEQEIEDSYALRESELDAAEIKLQLAKNAEFRANGLSQSFYEMADDLSDMRSEQGSLDREKRDDISDLSPQKRTEESSLNSDKAAALSEVVAEKNKELNKIKNYSFNKTTLMIYGMAFILAGIFIIMLPIRFLIKNFNALTSLYNGVKEKWSQIEVLLKRRSDLIPGIVEVVKGYSKHEKKTLKEVTLARNKSMKASTKNEEQEASNTLKTSLGKLFAVVEKYPDLKADKNFKDLQDNLKETEDKISVARQKYNKSVLIYKNKFEKYPSNLVAALFNFKEESFFDIDEEDTQNPKIDLK